MAAAATTGLPHWSSRRVMSVLLPSCCIHVFWNLEHIVCVRVGNGDGREVWGRQWTGPRAPKASHTLTSVVHLFIPLKDNEFHEERGKVLLFLESQLLKYCISKCCLRDG